MSKHPLRRLIGSILLINLCISAQVPPLDQPHLIPFPEFRMGGSYLTLVPTENLLVNSLPGGWTVNDPISSPAISFDLELLRYRWGDRLLTNPNMDAYSSLGYSVFTQLGSTDLPNSYPSSFLLNHSLVENFSLNAQINEFYLSHAFTYQYGSRNRFRGKLATGFAHANFYQNSSGIRLLGANGFGVHFGLGWKFRVLGQPGKRFWLGLDLGYSLRSFDLSGPQETLTLTDGSSGSLSPIQSISLNTPDVSLSVDLGEFLFGAYTPYRDPYRLGLLSFGIGYGINDYAEGEALQFDSSGTSMSVPIGVRVSRNVDVQLFKYNWPFHFIKQANVDLFSGLGLRLWNSRKSSTLPLGWARDLTDGTQQFSGMAFSPRLTDVYINHEIIYPLGERLHFRINGGTGFAMMTLYENVQLERLIDASGLTWQFGSGLGYTVRGDGSSKVAISLGFRYYHQAFDIDMTASNLSPVNASEIIPISHIDLSLPVFSLEIGLIFGGQANAAFKSVEAFKNKNFSKALELQTDLLEMSPDHHNRDALLRQKEIVQDSVTSRYYRNVREVLDRGKIEDALTLITRGRMAPDEAVDQAIQNMRFEIAENALERARLALEQLDHETAEKNILVALKSDPTTVPVAKALLSRSYIIRATILYQAGVYNRSLYWLKQADGLSDRYTLVTANLRQKIGEGRLDDANEGILKEDRQMAYESMQDAKAINPSLADIVDPHLKDLQAAIQHIDEQTLGPMKRMALDNLLDDIEGLSPEYFAPKIGMKAALIERYVGPPQRKFREGDYELWVYPHTETQEVWLYLQSGMIEKIEYPELD